MSSMKRDLSSKARPQISHGYSPQRTQRYAEERINKGLRPYFCIWLNVQMLNPPYVLPYSSAILRVLCGKNEFSTLELFTKINSQSNRSSLDLQFRLCGMMLSCIKAVVVPPRLVAACHLEEFSRRTGRLGRRFATSRGRGRCPPRSASHGVGSVQSPAQDRPSTGPLLHRIPRERRGRL